MVTGDWKTSLLERTDAAVQRGGRTGGATRARRGRGRPGRRGAGSAGPRPALGARLAERGGGARFRQRRLGTRCRGCRRSGAAVIVVQPQQTELVDELWVRLYPDDVAVHTHVGGPHRVRGATAGFAFWTETMAAGGNENLQRAAWRALCAKHGSRRAAWVAQRTEPQQIDVWPDRHVGRRPSSPLSRRSTSASTRWGATGRTTVSTRSRQAADAVEARPGEDEEGCRRRPSNGSARLVKTIEAKLGGVRPPPEGSGPRGRPSDSERDREAAPVARPLPEVGGGRSQAREAAGVAGPSR